MAAAASLGALKGAAGKDRAGTLLKRVFEPFFTTKAPDEGTGLGFSMVYRVCSPAEQCPIDSIPGQGTTMTLYRSTPRLI